MQKETAFNMASSNIRYGPGITREVGMDLADMGAKQVLVLTDPNLAELEPVRVVLESLEEQKVQFTLFDGVRVEPTDESLQEAIAFTGSQQFDAFVGIADHQLHGGTSLGARDRAENRSRTSLLRRARWPCRAPRDGHRW